MKALEGCRIESLDGEASRAWLEWVLGSGEAPRAVAEPAWLLAHSNGGVTWGRLEGGGWRLGSDAFPDLCPTPSEADLQELRVFSQEEEVMLWRTSGGLSGRLLRDHTPAAGEDPTRPADEERLLFAGRAGEHRDGFTRVGDGTGAEQALPLRLIGDPPSPWPRLRVRHYFTRDEETGAVRVGATRLVEVT